MPRQPKSPQERAARLAAKVEAIRKISPTSAELIEEWIDRLIAGEPLEEIKPEMDRLLEVADQHRRLKKK